MDALMRKIFLTSVKVNKPAASFVLRSKIGLPSVVPVGNSRFRYLSSSLRSSALHVPYHITELAGMAYINASFGISCRQRQTAEVPCQHKGGKTLQLCLRNLSCNNIERGKRFTVNDISKTAKFVVPIHL